MTRLDSPPHKPDSRRWMDEARGTQDFTKHTSVREQETAYLSLGRSGSSPSKRDNSPPPYRHMEVGHALPSTHIPESKASIPYRNPGLGVPSKRRSPEHDPFGRSYSPSKYNQHSNFRQPSPEQRRSRILSSRKLSPTPFKQAEILSKSKKLSNAHAQNPSYSSPKHPGTLISSPREGSAFSPSSPHSPSPFKQNDSLGVNSEIACFSQGQEEEPGSPANQLYEHRLDSESLYKNLSSIANSRSHYKTDDSHTVDNSHLNSHRSSHSRTGCDQSELTQSQSPQHGSTHSLTGVNFSGNPSPPRWCLDYKPLSQSPKNQDLDIDAAKGSPDTWRPSPDCIQNDGLDQSPSPPRQRQALLQTSGESERNHEDLTIEKTNIQEYVIMADLPKAKMIQPREEFGSRSQSKSPMRGDRYRTNNHFQLLNEQKERDSSGERGRGRERGRNRQRRHEGEKEKVLSVNPSVMVNTSESDRGENQPRQDPSVQLIMGHPGRITPEKLDLLNFKKGWMSMLDENGEWRKHWFVLVNAGLRYYRDTEAEENNDVDGEIDLGSCTGVTELDVEKNYGIQIQAKDGVLILSAVTSGIRRNWIEVLSMSIPPNRSVNIYQLSNSYSDHEEAHPSPEPHSSSQQPPYEATSVVATQCPSHYVEQTVTSPAEKPAIADKHLGRRLEDRSRWFHSGLAQEMGGNPWDAVQLKKSPASMAEIEEELERKWTEFERIPFRETKSQLLVGDCTAGQLPDGALQGEGASSRRKLEVLQRGGMKDGLCGPGASCSHSLEGLEKAHKEAMVVLQKQHEQELQDLERERDRMLHEEAQATTQAMEVLKKALRKELEEEVARVQRLNTGGGDAQTPHKLQEWDSETQAIKKELDSLSEMFSQKCLELNKAEQNSKEQAVEISRKNAELEQLKKQNQELQTRLTEEMSRMRSFLTGQEERLLPGNRDNSFCEPEVQLRAKEKEMQFLQQEIGCLRGEVLSLNKEKRSVWERYKEVYEDLNGMKSRSEREIEALREHLRLAMAALQEGQQLENSFSH